MHRITVNASKPYSLLIGEGLLNRLPEHIIEAFDSARPQTLCIVSDDVVWDLYGESLKDCLENAGFQIYHFVFPHGEESKTLSTAGELLEFLAANKLTRSDALIALGGGVTGDLTGFAAAVYLRGVPFIQVPTTLLAAVDSSVGGKTGVNLSFGKNLAGAFWQPSLVLFDVDTIKTLPQEEKMDGLAEACKAAAIADADLLSYIIKTQEFSEPDAITHLVRSAVKIKREIVEKDEQDRGKRQLLNLGHTVGHAVEMCSNYSISHGHCVAIGIAIEAKASTAEGWCDSAVSEAIIDALKSLGFSLSCPYSADQLVVSVLQDKKRMGDNITLAVPLHLGKAQLKTIPVSDLKGFLIKGLPEEGKV